MIQLTLTEVAASYGPRLVLNAISFNLQKGDVLVVQGQNGSGKSTLLRLLAGLQKPTTGTINYFLQDTNFTPREAAPFLGWVAPDLMLYRELTARENLKFFAQVRGLTYSKSEIDALLTKLGLAGRGDDWVAHFSSGMTQRLRYAYALFHQPLVLLLDEPTVTLDEQGAALVANVIAEQRQRGITVIATNDPTELRFGDYILELSTAVERAK